jgi:DNA-binding NarL/FixJ family response regulator
LRHHPDLILLDLLMPEMSGMAMLKKLREDSWGKQARVIILTNVSDNKEIAEVLHNKTYDYFVKADTKIEDLVEIVKKKLEV